MQSVSKIINKYSVDLISGKKPFFKNTVKTFSDGHVISQVDSSEYGSITCMRIAHLIVNHRHELHKQDLILLKGALHFRANFIHAKTKGVLGFFKYLFKRSLRKDMQKLQKNLKALEAFVTHILKTEGKVKKNKNLNHEIIIPPEPVQEDVPPPPVDEADDIPPPPAPPPPPINSIAKVVFFKFSDNEPDEPAIELTKYNKCLNESRDTYIDRLNKEIQIIEAFIAKMKESMSLAKTIKAKVLEIEERLAEKLQMRGEVEARVNILKEKIDALEQAPKDEVVFLRFPIKNNKGKIIDWKLTPYYSKEQFEKNNEELAKIKQKPLPPSLQKEVALEYLKENYHIENNEFHQIKIEIENLEKELMNTKNNKLKELVYNQFIQELSKKELRMQLWENALKNRQKVLIKKDEQKVVQQARGNIPVLFPGHEQIMQFTTNMNILLKQKNAINSLVHPPEQA